MGTPPCLLGTPAAPQRASGVPCGHAGGHLVCPGGTPGCIWCALGAHGGASEALREASLSLTRPRNTQQLKPINHFTGEPREIAAPLNSFAQPLSFQPFNATTVSTASQYLRTSATQVWSCSCDTCLMLPRRHPQVRSLRLSFSCRLVSQVSRDGSTSLPLRAPQTTSG